MTFSPVIVTTTFWSWIMSLVTTLGNFTLMLDWNVNDEANKKKTSSKKKQSIIGATWIGRKPYSSLLLLLNFMHCTPFDHLANKISQLGRRPFHFQDQAINAAHAKVVRDKSRNGHQQSDHGGDERFADPPRQVTGGNGIQRCRARL